MLNRVVATALLFLSFGAEAAVGKSIPPSPRSYIYDEPHLLSPSGYQQISRYLGEQDRQTGNQVLVAIFNSTDGEDPVDFTNRLFKAWNPGQKGKDNGALLAIYLKDKRTRIEVGYGLEPVLTDAKSMRILNNILKPAFQQQKFDEGIFLSVKSIHDTIANPDAEPAPNRDARSERLPSWAFLILFGGIFGFLYLYDRFYPNTYTLSSGRRTRRRSPWDSGFGGGGFGGGGFGGGGFGGGGGSSGGGGASGSW